MRLIDADSLMSKLRREPRFEKTDFDKAMLYVEKSIIDSMPTIDAVKVVRCKDCKHWDKERLYCHHPAGLSFCGKTGAEKGFCCFGERRCE